MKDTLLKIKAEALSAITQDGADLEALRIRYLGKKGELTAVLRGMGKLSAEERPVIGQIANEVREAIENELVQRAQVQKAAELDRRLAAEKIDVTVPGTEIAVGHIHPLDRVQRDMEEIFIGMGFDIVEGPEVEYDYYNFQALNIPTRPTLRSSIRCKVWLWIRTSPWAI